MSKKKERVSIFPYYISEQPKEKQRINLLLISEDVEDVNEDTDEDTCEGTIYENYDPDTDYTENPTERETKYHYCFI